MNMLDTTGYISRKTFARWEKQKQYPAIADGIRYNTLLSVARAGTGHLGASLSMMELITEIYFRSFTLDPQKKEDPHRDIFILSKGHAAPGLYALLAAKGYFPTERLDQLRRWGGLQGHCDIDTPGIEANTGSLAMGLSKAVGYAIAKKKFGWKGSVLVVVGDAELQEGQCWEALISAVSLNCDNLYVVIDDNEVQTDRYTRHIVAYGNLPGAVRELGFAVTEGNAQTVTNVHSLIQQAKRQKGKPKLLWCHTKKGQGVAYMEHDTVLTDQTKRYVWHNKAPNPEQLKSALQEVQKRIQSSLGTTDHSWSVADSLQSIPREPMQIDITGESVLKGFSQALVEWGTKDESVIVLDADLEEDSGFIPFHKHFPKRFLEMGIMEQHLVGTATALSRSGNIPVFASYAAFLTSRANEQIYNLASEGGRAVIVGNMAGVIPATPGKSHQGFRDIALMKNIPGIWMYQPITPDDVGNILRRYQQGEMGNLLYLRLSLAAPAVSLPTPPEDLAIGAPQCVLRGTDAAIVALGPVLAAESIKAADMAKKKGLSVAVWHYPWIDTVSLPLWSEIIRLPFVLVEDHYYQGGMGESVLAALALAGRSGIRCRHLALRMMPQTGFRQEALEGFGLSSFHISSAIVQLLHG